MEPTITGGQTFSGCAENKYLSFIPAQGRINLSHQGEKG